MEGLFGAVDLVEADSGNLPGYRLDRIELYNWGTFGERVWNLEAAGQNTLLTGEVGSGKSTVVDAITTLLLPAHKISYNKAAGAEKQERSLRSYVLGHYKSERREESNVSRPVALRDASSFSVILGVFRNQGFDGVVTLAQVFWTKEGLVAQPERFFVTADRALSVFADFADFGGNIGELRRRLTKSGAQVRGAFPEYGRDFRRLLGIPSEQAMDLFHQTVSMKSVGNLNDFVRGHMLEPFDAKKWTEKLVAHFEDLSSAHAAVRKAQDQLADLTPLLTDCDAVESLQAEITSRSSLRTALPYFVADRKAILLRARIELLQQQIADGEAEISRIRDRLIELHSTRTRLQLERAGHGGDRLAEIERSVEAERKTREQRQQREARFGELLRQAGLAEVDTGEQFIVRRREIVSAATAADVAHAEHQNRLTDLAVEVKSLKVEADELSAELRSLRDRPSNIPKTSLDVRSRLCQAIGVEESALPFAGELIKVAEESSTWEGAAERLLHSFGLSLLVREAHYRAASAWINANNLRARIVFYRVPERMAADRQEDSAGHQLFRKLVVKDSPFFAWLTTELRKRADYECVESMDHFHRSPRAITIEGLIKSERRHEKNDLTSIHDRRHYVLGWNNEQKVQTLLEQAARIYRRQAELTAEQDRVGTAVRQAADLLTTLARLTDFEVYEELDWQSVVNRIQTLLVEKAALEKSSRELSRLTAALEATEADIDGADAEKDALVNTVGGVRTYLQEAAREHAVARSVLAAPEYAGAETYFAALTPRFDDRAVTDSAGWDAAATDVGGALTREIESRSARATTMSNRATSKMGEFRRKYPQETAELDDSVRSADGYRELRARLVDDDLPRFESKFKNLLNTNAIRDIAGFHAQLNREVDLIKERIDIINESVHSIDYNEARYIRLEPHPTDSVEIRDFRTDLRDCTDGSLSADDSVQYSEQKFFQVKRIIERFKGREGQTEIDRLWTRRVTDVRNWFVFNASERWRSDDTEHENYADSGGKSGGQKEKLAYTILAASLAYQFKLDWGTAKSRTFRFVVIDEAFGRGSNESTRFGLMLFQRLGLQLLIVTPLQKINVIEPFVAAVGFVDNNRDGNRSRLQCLTIKEFRERKAAGQEQSRPVDGLGA